jgi:steroid 5-alpha reductase family enzyme
MIRMAENRSRSFAICGAAYVVALGVAFAAVQLAPAQDPIWTALIADVAATVAVFAFSWAYDNSSFYDAYWSVAPIPLAIWWALLPQDAGGPWLREALVLGLVSAWGVRLTWNWARGWPGLHHEDWRYRELRENSNAPYWLVSLTGIHYFPTLQVFLACLPLYAALAIGSRPLGALDALAALVTAGAIALETIADEQLRAFNREKQPGEICARGLWAWLRHPNYLGEILFWWGLWLFGVAAAPSWYWSVIGPLAITAMFLFASIPMLDRRNLERRPGYAEVMKSVPALVPRRPRR